MNIVKVDYDYVKNNWINIKKIIQIYFPNCNIYKYKKKENDFLILLIFTVYMIYIHSHIVYFIFKMSIYNNKIKFYFRIAIILLRFFAIAFDICIFYLKK